MGGGAQGTAEPAACSFIFKKSVNKKKLRAVFHSSKIILAFLTMEGCLSLQTGLDPQDENHCSTATMTDGDRGRPGLYWRLTFSQIWWHTLVIPLLGC